MRRRQHPFYNEDVNTIVVGLITDSTGDTGATLPGSAAMSGEDQETDYLNFNVNTNVVGLITDCTCDSGAIAGVRGSAAVRSRGRIIRMSK